MRKTDNEFEKTQGKVCKGCDKWILFEFFGKRSSAKDGKMPICRKCVSKINSSRTGIAEYNRAYRKENKEEIKAYSKEYQAGNRDTINKTARDLYDKNKEKVNAASRKRYHDKKSNKSPNDL
ncbi:MAG: hypothetical protein HRT88_00165 [Lentisphaeraceae bacterium]|nr:hypothetical protein [Lentisphaeraceae bacterium]